MSATDAEVAGWYADDLEDEMENREALISFLRSLAAP